MYFLKKYFRLSAQYFFRKIQDLLVSFGVNNLLFVLGIKFIPRALRRFDPFLNKMSRIFGELFEVFREEREEHERTYQEGEMRDFIDVYIKESRRADKEGDKGAERKHCRRCFGCSSIYLC